MSFEYYFYCYGWVIFMLFLINVVVYVVEVVLSGGNFLSIRGSVLVFFG